MAQQVQWHKRFNERIKFLRKRNTGLCKLTGKQFGELMKHFIVGGDKSNFLADADGNLKIYAEKGRAKHEKKSGDYRGSLTAMRYRRLIRVLFQKGILISSWIYVTN